jgi:uncharacterized protein YecE (DUF72 family)
MPRRVRSEQVELFSVPKREHPYAELSERLWSLAARGVYFGSSSWKYESWWKNGEGPVYIEDYHNRRNFEQNCLAEYAKTFPAVGADFTFYNWPSVDQVNKLDLQTPAGFKFGLKATEFITLKRFPSIERWGLKAGLENPDFLNAALFETKFLEPVRPLLKTDKLAPILIEFTTFPRGAFSDWTEFADLLERFFDKLPDDFTYAVEIRTREYFHTEFLAALKAMGALPCINSWTRMPPLDEQWKMVRELDFPAIACRPIMRPGRTRDEAHELFYPYDKLKERVEPARKALVSIAEWALEKRRGCYVFVNNHLEGCAHRTIDELTTFICS